MSVKCPNLELATMVIKPSVTFQTINHHVIAWQMPLLYIHMV